MFNVHPQVPQSLDGWQDGDVRLLIEEGRRQIDRQLDDLTHVRSLAQFLFTTTIGVIVVLVAGLHWIGRHGGIVAILVWGVGLLVAVLGLLGAGAVVVAKGQFGSIDASLLSAEPSPVDRELAFAYARIVGIGENTVSTRQTVFRDAASLVMVGGVIHAAVWLMTR